MKTHVVKTEKNKILVRGSPIEEWARGKSYFEALLDLHGIVTGPDTVARCERVALLMCDHGINPPSTIAARLAASCGATVQGSMIAALACLSGDYHLQAVRRVADFVKRRLSGDRTELPRNIPGLGHPLHDGDPRVAALLAEFGAGDAVREMRSVSAIAKRPINAAGACASVLLDGGIPADLTPIPVLLGRMLGISLHWREQSAIKQKAIGYDGERFMED